MPAPLAQPADHELLLTPGEVASIFAVDPKTVTRWANAGRLTVVRTLGGHRRFLDREVRALAAAPPQRRRDGVKEAS